MKTIKQQRLEAKSKAQCDRWNELNPEGCAVTLRKDGGTILHTTTRSAAYVCSAGYPVIFLVGVSGYYLLDRIDRRLEPILSCCPTCQSPSPTRHPATQHEGEVTLCRDPWHKPSAAEIEAQEAQPA